MGGRGSVLTGDDRALLEPAADARTRWIGEQVIAGITALSAFAAVFLVASTFSFSVLQRRRELGLLHAIGATPKQLRRMMLGEAVLVGAAASACGVLLGALAAPLLGSLLVDAGFEPPSFEIRYGALPLAAAFTVGLLVALAGVWAASRRGAKVRPLEALRTAEVERTPMTLGRWIAGLGALGLGTLMGVATATADPESMPTTAAGAAMALTVGMSLLAPVFVPPLAALVMAPLRRGPVGLLVRQHAFTSARRTAATAAPVLLSVAFGVLIGGMVQTTTAAYAARREAAFPAEAALEPDGTPGLSDAAVRSMPGGSLALMPTTVYLGSRALSVMGRSDLTDGVVVAASLGFAPGQAVELTVPNGQTVTVRVAKVADDQLVDIVAGRDWVIAHDSNALTAAVLLPSAASAPAAAPPGARVVDARTYAAQADAEEDRLVWTFTLLFIVMAVGFTVLAVANTLVMGSVGRRRELSVLGRVGATRGQLTRFLAAETILIVFVGTVLGLLVALPALAAIRAGLAEQIGRSIPLAVPWSAFAATVGACLLAALAAAIVPHLHSRHNTVYDAQ